MNTELIENKNECERPAPVDVSHHDANGYPIACVLCGTQENVLIFPHRKGKQVVGMNPHAQQASGLDCCVFNPKETPSPEALQGEISGLKEQLRITTANYDEYHNALCKIGELVGQPSFYSWQRVYQNVEAMKKRLWEISLLAR